MATHDRIVIGASAGGVEALRLLVAALPADLPAALFVVLHLPAWHRSELPAILTASGHLPASHPKDGERIVNGNIYVAPPGRHLVIEDGHVHLSTAPQENRHRPSVNVLFRSAAEAYGSRVTGIILTGALDDGTSGLWEIKRRGGLAVVQDPSEALFPDMPANAIQNVEIDHTVPLSEMAALLTTLASEPADIKGWEKSRAVEGMSTQITCPECRGPITRHAEGAAVQLRCRVGHAYSPEGYLAAHAQTRERVLWEAILALEEGSDAARDLLKTFPPGIAQIVEREASDTERAALAVRELLASLIRNTSERLSAA